MAVPEVIPWEKVDVFRFGSGSRSPGYQDIHLEYFLDSLEEPTSLGKDTFLRKHVYCIDTDGNTLDKWQAYKCLYAEIDHDGDSFLLSGGKWYRVSRDFVEEVNEAYRKIPVFSGHLPEYNDQSETAYNKRVADSEPSTFALMDCKVILHGGSYGRVEFCDLYTKDKTIFHVKRYGGASVLSHLFAQALISGELFQMDSEFRRKVHEQLPAGFKLENANQKPASGEYQVVFAVISDVPGDLLLPFFSRLNLKHAVRRLGGYGYKVARAKISVDEKLSKLKKY